MIKSRSVHFGKVIVLLACCLFISLSYAPGLALGASNLTSWGPYRGVTVKLNLSEKDIADLASMGANLIRLTAAKDPLMRKEPPYDIIKGNVQKMDQIIAWCEKFGIRVVIDPHTFPGTRNDFTMMMTDRFWKSYEWHEHTIRLWDFLAQHYKNYGEVIAGYDLLNEPAIPRQGEPHTPTDWNALSKKLVETIRRHDPKRPIIIEPPASRDGKGKKINRHEGMRLLAEPFDPYLIYSPHMYSPGEFTRQGVNGRPRGVSYPGNAGGKYWDKEALRKSLLPIIEFQKKYNVPIYIGEFSASIWGGESANRYVRDLIEIFEELGWSWTYHSFRQAAYVDAEKTAESPGVRKKSTPRLEILKAAYSKNKKTREPQSLKRKTQGE